MNWKRRFFECPVCASSVKPGLPRPASGRNTFEFNKVVGVDYFYHGFRGSLRAWLNMLCWGTSRMRIAPYADGGRSPTAEKTFSFLLATWVDAYGWPEVIVCDQGKEFFGEEFGGQFQQHGVLVHIIDSKAPWQNGSTERAGGVLKELLDKTINETAVDTEEEYLVAASAALAARNSRADRSGFSPDQRAFGRNLRLPGVLLSDDRVDADLLAAQAGDDLQRKWEIQDAAAKATVVHRDKDAAKKALAHRRPGWQDREFRESSWVFVWRSPAHSKGGWRGPGVLLTLFPNKKSVWVNMRAVSGNARGNRCDQPRKKKSLPLKSPGSSRKQV